MDPYRPFVLSKTTFHIRGFSQLTNFSLNQDQACRLFVDGVEVSLTDSLKRNHSPDEFNWGYALGPAQSALAICLHIFQNPYVAEVLYQPFKTTLVAHWQPQMEAFDVTIDITNFLMENQKAVERAFQLEADDEEWAGLTLIEEAERLLQLYPDDSGEIPPVEPTPVSRYSVGDVLRTTAAILDCPAGARAVVYDMYEYAGVSILTEDGNDLGTFSFVEQESFFEFLYHPAGFSYEFSSINQLYRDFYRGVFAYAFT